MKFEVLIVGGGAAGSAAGINLARANRHVCLIDDGNPRNRFSEHAHGVLGMDAINPGELLAKGHREFELFGGTLLHGRVETLRREEGGEWTVALSSGAQITALNVLVATGLTDELPKVPGLSELWGERVFHCPYCHGYEVKGKTVAVVGGENPGFTFRVSSLITKWARSVTLYLNGLNLPSDQSRRLRACGVSIASTPVESVAAVENDSDGVEIHTMEGRERFEACFTGPNFTPNDALLRQAGCAVSDSWVKVEGGRTSQPGIWAVGNVVSSSDQMSQAAGAGAAIAIAIDQDMFDTRINSLLD